MLVNGMIAHKINPKWVQLKLSRGFESEEHKVFMRWTVLVADITFFFSAVLCMFLGDVFDLETLLCLMLYPGLILIDSGHFQYNCVSLGLTLWSIYFLHRQNTVMASVFFTLAINYKQISMYHSFAFFFYLLGDCMKKPSVISKISSLSFIALSVIFVFFVSWMPFLFNFNDAKQVVNRLFPVSRGLFEDKVANIWCPLEVVIKLRKMFPPESLFKLSAVVTLTSLLPSGIHLLFNPCLRNFRYNLVISSLSFFLFSFQVHEKGILLVAIPVCLLFKYHPLLVAWFLLVSSFRSVFFLSPFLLSFI